jgi:hypothetical protein
MLEETPILYASWERPYVRKRTYVSQNWADEPIYSDVA